MATGTVIQKIIDNHITDGEKREGMPIEVKVDQTLMQDATGTMVFLELEAMGVKKIKTELSNVYIDHNTMLIGPENRNDHIFLQSMADSMGLHYSRPGNGICHQVHLERFGVPGKILLGADSHTPTNGGLGMLSIGSGGLDIAQAIAGKPFKMTYPKVIGVELTSTMKPWVTAKDIILKLLSILTTKGNVGCAIEYYGEGLKFLTVPERASITNMGTELGVTASIFPSDEQTKLYMKAQSRESSWIELNKDENAVFDDVIRIDLDKLEPLAACPSSPDNVKKITELKDIVVDQVIIGSCTNSSYMDLALVAAVLENNIINENVTVSIAPGSKQVMEMLAADGKLATIISSGVKVLESACGPCVGQGQSPAEGTVSLRTFNRNFSGRSGTKLDQVFLVSPAVAIVSALTGKITDPCSAGLDYPVIELPKAFIINDNMIIKPKSDNLKLEKEIVRKSTIKAIPENTGLPSSIDGKVVIKVGDKVTTDHIMPAGKYLKYRSNIYEYSKAVFNCYQKDGKSSFADKCLALKSKNKHCVIVGGESYGQGSSREHAALCPMYLGIKVVISKSIERIHRTNLINFGIIPLNFNPAGDYDNIDQDDSIIIENVIDQLQSNQNICAEIIKSDGVKLIIMLSHDLNENEIDTIKAGGILNIDK